MKNKIIIFLLTIILFIPCSVFALSKDYVDNVASIMGEKPNVNKVSLYLFYGEECPHCEEERHWLDNIKEKYSEDLDIYMYEVWHNDDNSAKADIIREKMNIDRTGVPLTVVGNKYYVGFSETIGSVIENTIKEYAVEEKSTEVEIPILGRIDMKNVSIPLVAVVLGFIDGFNPCAMWVLLFLINMLFGVKNKKKAWVLGLTFLFISGFVYFLSMLGINLILGIATVNWMRAAIALFILVAGIFNLRKYLKIRKEEAGCVVVDKKKRKKLATRMKSIIETRSFILALIGISVLAISVNLIELACSLGFPLIFTEILTLNEVSGVLRFVFLIIYILFYMIDDIFVFTVSMVTLEATGITNKYNKLCTLVSAIIMIIMGVLLIVKPEWIMLNF